VRQKKEDVKLDLNTALEGFQKRKVEEVYDEQVEKEKMNQYYREINARAQAIDDEIAYRLKIKQDEFKQKVSDLKMQKMMTKKEEQKQLADLKKKQMDEDAFMEAILEQKKQLILEAIKSLGLDDQDLPKGTGLNTIK